MHLTHLALMGILASTAPMISAATPSQNDGALNSKPPNTNLVYRPPPTHSIGAPRAKATPTLVNGEPIRNPSNLPPTVHAEPPKNHGSPIRHPQASLTTIATMGPGGQPDRNPSYYAPPTDLPAGVPDHGSQAIPACVGRGLYVCDPCCIVWSYSMGACVQAGKPPKGWPFCESLTVEPPNVRGAPPGCDIWIIGKKRCEEWLDGIPDGFTEPEHNPKYGGTPLYGSKNYAAEQAMPPTQSRPFKPSATILTTTSTSIITPYTPTETKVVVVTTTAGVAAATKTQITTTM